jgi:hypothetical protein
MHNRLSLFASKAKVLNLANGKLKGPTGVRGANQNPESALADTSIGR